jgi:hypothetical protein
MTMSQVKSNDSENENAPPALNTPIPFMSRLLLAPICACSAWMMSSHDVIIHPYFYPSSIHPPTYISSLHVPVLAEP